MAKLTTKARKALPASDFSGPDRSYPIDTANRARNALSRVSQFGSPELKAKVRGKVHAKYPSIGEKKADPPKSKRHYGSMAPVSGKYPKYGAGHYLSTPAPGSDEEE